MAVTDTAMVIACSAAWNGYRPMSTIDQTTHFLRPVSFDVVVGARVVRIGRDTSFGRVMPARSSGQTARRNGGERVFNAVKNRRRIFSADHRTRHRPLPIPRRNP